MTDYRTAPRRTNESPLARIRIARGLTQGQLAEKVGCRQKDISRWESGTKPGAAYLLKLSSALGCRIEDILA
ncbi:MAG: helix-turn-helix transcriptional regulator [Candidatus Ventricola sp.]